MPAEKIIMEHYRLGSTRAILSRTFCDNAIVQDIKEIERVFELNMKKVRDFESSLNQLDLDKFEVNKAEVKEIVDQVVRIIKEKRSGNK